MKHETALRIAISTPTARDTSAASWDGTWINQMGSTMTLTIAGNEVAGTYTSKTSSIDDGGPVDSVDLKGFVAGDLISLVVLWPGNSMTAWTGQIVDDLDDPQITTLWHLVTDLPDADEPARLWKSTLAGADVFHRSNSHVASTS